MVKVEAKHFNICILDYEVIGYYENMAIVTDELDNMYYVEDAKDILPIGTVIDSLEVLPITKLSHEQQEEIKYIYKK